MDIIAGHLDRMMTSVNQTTNEVSMLQRSLQQLKGSPEITRISPDYQNAITEAADNLNLDDWNQA